MAVQPSPDTLPSWPRFELVSAVDPVADAYASLERGSDEVFDPDRARALGLAVSGDVRPAD